MTRGMLLEAEHAEGASAGEPEIPVIEADDLDISAGVIRR